jgi:hypothetical protein
LRGNDKKPATTTIVSAPAASHFGVFDIPTSGGVG